MRPPIVGGERVDWDLGRQAAEASARGESGRTAGRTGTGVWAKPSDPDRGGRGALAGGNEQDRGDGQARGDRLRLQEAGGAGRVDPGLRGLDMAGPEGVACTPRELGPEGGPRLGASGGRG